MYKGLKLLLGTLMMVLIVGNLNSQTVVTADDDTLCAGESTMITASGSSTYAWSPATGLDTVVGDTVIANPSVTTTYTVIGTVGMNSDTQMVTIVVNGLPTVSVVSGEDTTCSAYDLMLYASGADTYTWTGANGTSINGDTALANPTISGYITATGTDSNGCSNMDSANVVVLPLPNVSISAPTFLCTNTPTALYASGGVSYLWSPSSILNDTTSATVFATITTTSSVTLWGTGANGCVKQVNTTLLASVEIPNVSILASDSIVCAGDSVMMSASGTPNVSYLWRDLTGGNSLLNNTESFAWATPNTTTTYELVVNKNGCKDSTQVSITANALPSVLLSQSSGGNAICKDEADTITVTSNAVTFVWHLPGSSVTTSSKVKSIAPGETTIIRVEGIGPNGCRGEGSIVINVDTSCGEGLGLTELVESKIKAYWSSESNELVVETPAELSPDLKVTLLSINGEAVLNTRVDQPMRFRLNGLSSGVYMLHIEGEAVEHKKIFIE